MKRLALVLFVVLVTASTGSALGAPKGGSGNGKGGGKGGGNAPASNEYRQPVWFEWETATLDVLIVPPEHGQVINDNGVLDGGDPNELNPYENSYLKAVEASVAGWDRGVETFGASWLRSGLVTNVYVAGRDTIPTAALEDPEIVIASDQTKANILGVAVSTRPCLVDNSKFFVTSFTYEDMYNINGQEYGHCLGLDHVEGGAPGDEVIAHDVMNGEYADTPGAAGTHLHCVSNLNVKGLELVFGALFGQPHGGAAVMDTSAYQRISC